MPALNDSRFKSAHTEAANRAEATALLIRCGYKVYRPEVDADGEDLVLCSPAGGLIAVQLKSRVFVDMGNYGNKGLWMLFPSNPFSPTVPREWFLVPHDRLYALLEEKHSNAPTWKRVWSYRSIPSDVKQFLKEWKVQPAPEPQ